MTIKISDNAQLQAFLQTSAVTPFSMHHDVSSDSGERKRRRVCVGGRRGGGREMRYSLTSAVQVRPGDSSHWK